MNVFKLMFGIVYMIIIFLSFFIFPGLVSYSVVDYLFDKDEVVEYVMPEGIYSVEYRDDGKCYLSDEERGLYFQSQHNFESDSVVVLHPQVVEEDAIFNSSILKGIIAVLVYLFSFSFLVSLLIHK